MRITLRGFSCAVLLAGMLCSCQKELAQVEQPETEINMVAAEFSAVTEAGMPTRMTLGEGLKPAWEAGDKLAVWDGSLVTAFSVKKAEGSFAKFDGQVAEGSDEYYALFPHTEGITFDAEAKAFKTVIPSEQIISQGDSVCASALMGMAYAPKPAEGQAQFAFRNVCGLIKVDVPESGKIASIVISSNGEETFVGEGTVSLQKKTEGQLTQTIPVFAPAEGAGKTVILRPEGENATFEKGSYYAVVAPVEFQTGFSINMVRTDGAAGKISTDQPMKVVRNGGTNLKDIVAVSDWSLEIWTKEQLFAWGRNWGRLDKVTLMADIDMEEELWTPVGDGDNWFCGVFDGNQKKIYNFNVNTDGYAGFIGHLAGEGCVRNLTIGSKDGTNYDGKSAIIHTPSKDEYGWNYVGVVAKLSGSATVTGVTNYAELSIPESEFKVKACMGGIAGIHQGGGTISQCTNAGSIDFMAATGSNGVNVIGGIVSKTDAAATIENCTNSGTITNKNAGVLYIGGIIGNTHSSTDKTYTVNLTSNTNAGNIDVQAVGTDESAAGGICGLVSGATLTTCANTGVISVTAGSLVHVGGVAGMYRLSYGAKLDRCVNGTENMTESLFAYNATAGQTRLGGVLGHCHESSGKLELVGCYNHSPINISHAGLRQVGGLCSAVAKGVELSVDDCHNTGDITLGNVASSHSDKKQFGGLFGYLGSESGKTFEIKNSTNTGDVETSVSGGGETQVAGITGYLGAYVSLSKCVNEGAVSGKNSAFKPRIGGIAGVADATGAKILSCENKGGVTNSSANNNLYVGGIVAFAKNITIGVAEGELKGCVNAGEVKVTAAGGESKIGGIAGQAENVTIEKSYNQNKVSFSASKQPRMGGIVGNIVQNVTIDDCHNDTNGVIENTAAGSTTTVGGLVGRWSGQGSAILNSSNSCTVNAKVSDQSQIVGGIVGSIEGGNATGKQNELITCTNSGKIEITHGSTTGKYVRAAGIAGSIGLTSNNTVASNVKISGCTNLSSGVVWLESENAATCHLGGIVGTSHAGVEYSSNENCADITGTSKGNLYIGGVWGYDYQLVGGHTAKDVSGNVNTGNLSAFTSGEIYVGGLFGIVRKVAVANLKSDNTNYGNVTCAGGALAGRSDIATWQGKVGKNVLVNGVLWNNWAEGEEAKWLCPVATNPVTANYVDAPSN